MLQVHIDAAGYQQKELYLNDIHFTIHPGEIVGLLGANGAGKSTTIKSIIGTIEHFYGNIDLEKGKQLAYIPEEPILYDRLTLWEHLRLAATSYEMPDDIWAPRAKELLKKFSLTGKEHELPIHFSKGMRQKTLICLSFMTQADIYIIDEPFIGLDPIATKHLINMLYQEKERGAAILMSTHVLDSAEKLCDRFILLNGGQNVFQGELQELQLQTNQPAGTSLLDCFYELLEEGAS
ncbi:ABC transporter ATP-binding protein [Oceanobacillus sp. J11TS1]|uniref:ABC transporter ATP-binding protein n=1 Tax=Oceanobacillus sp. J11TS1 TaxID=2807191 RepID=UPI001B0FD8FD|nr:ABC transporter ATP-binding protein [Oceanobacillus sp. J11TS1]GIO24637.1 multidrug ABC transporter ATP-binding protein [Oceanobacillus sp. J11TS1]